MIPILYPSTETAFTSEGLGRLTDARKCEVTEERNGTYELVLEYPVSGDLTTELVPRRYIFATHDDSGVPQAFQIYNVSIPLEGFVTVRAWHISYALNTIVVEPFTASTCASAMAGLSTNSMNTNPFTFWTDKTVSADFAVTTPKSVREVLGGSAGSILDVYGKGEYEFDMFTVKLHLNRGQNNGVQIRYGKNLTKLDQTLDGGNVYNAIVPFWQSDEYMVYVDHPVVRTGETAKGVVAYDLSGAFEEAPTPAELETMAQSVIDASNNYTLKENLNVDFVPLWQTEEYKQYADLERVKLCDTVNIFYERAGVNATAQVIKVVYNTLLDRYSSMELGEPKTTLSQQIMQDVSGSILADVPSTVRRTISRGDLEISGCVGIKVEPGLDTYIPAYQVKDFSGTIAGDMIMTLTTINGNRYPRRFRWRQYGIDQSDYSRQTYCETFSLPTGGLDLSANTNYDIWTTKTIPAPPSTNGTYTLKATVNNGTVTYSWV